MSVEFILGRSGCGKTRYCIDAIVRHVRESSSVQNLVLLVPEQATYQAEKAILSYSGVEGYHGLKVLSFDRLGFWLLGKSAAGSELSRIAQEMVVNRLLRANAGKLKIFDRAADMAGTASKLARIITELQESDMAPEDLRELLAGLEKDQPGGITNCKFHDIAVIFESYLEFIAGSDNNFINPDVRLENARQMVSQAEFLKDAFVWVDGFASFTVQQQQLLAEMVKVSNQTRIALCLDPTKLDVNKPKADDLDPYSLFAATEYTYLELFSMAKKIGAKIARPICLSDAKRFENSRDLKTLESNLFGVRKGDAIKHSGDISIVSAPNPRAEVQYVASQILKLVRQDGLRFKDIAVIASDMEAYKHYIEAAFNDMGLSYFIDRTKGLTTHPVVELIGSALAAGLEGFSSSDVLAYLKTGLGSVKGSDVDLLENYCIAYGIGNADWTRESKWAFAEKNNELFDEAMIDKLRKQAAEPLIKLKESLCGNSSITAEQFVCAVWDFLESLSVRQQLAELAGPDPDSEHEHFQFYDKMVGLFDEMTEVFADEMIGAEDFMFIVGNAFSQLVLKHIPPRLDQVLVGSIERSRHPDLKVVFLLGTTQKQFPASLSFDSILTEDDLLAAQSHEFDLRDTLSSRLAERQYLAYIAFTRPSEKLFIMYPASVDGKPVVASAFLNDVKELFEDLQETWADSRVNIADACTQSQLEDIVCASAGKDSILNESERQAFYGLIDKLKDADDLCDSQERITYALKYNNIAELDSNRLKKKARGLDCSSSRLSNFAECPYKHFAKYELGLKKRKQFTFEPVDIGSFYHAVLDGLFKKLKAKGKDFATVEYDQLLVLLDEQVKEIIAGDPFYLNFLSRGLHNEFILYAAQDVLADAVQAYSQMSRAGQFRQKGSEQWFGKGKQNCQFDLPGKAKVRLSGIIDRIDTATIDGKETAVVFDYKLSSRSFSWTNLYYGLDMQLAIYLLALKGADVDGQRIEEVVGAFYLPIDVDADGEKFVHKAKGLFDGKFAGSLDGDAPSGWNKYYNFYNSKDGPYGNYKTSGALKPGSLEEVLAFTTQRIVTLATQILGDAIEVSPYRLGKKSPCGYCDYRSVCRFDWQVNSYNVLNKFDNKQHVLDQMGGTDGE